MYRTEIITHFKKFHGLSELTESFQIDIDCIEAIIEDMKLVKENCNLPIVTNCAFPEWLDNETRAKAKEAWDYHEKGVEYYYERDFNSALVHFKKTQSLIPGDYCSILFIQRCQKYKKDPPPENWTGDTVLNRK